MAPPAIDIPELVEEDEGEDIGIAEHLHRELQLEADPAGGAARDEDDRERVGRRRRRRRHFPLVVVEFSFWFNGVVFSFFFPKEQLRACHSPARLSRESSYSQKRRCEGAPRARERKIAIEVTRERENGVKEE